MFDSERRQLEATMEWFYDTGDSNYPRVRAACKCPLCAQAKDAGLLACWYCYRRELEPGASEATTRMLDAAEANALY